MASTKSGPLCLETPYGVINFLNFVKFEIFNPEDSSGECFLLFIKNAKGKEKQE